MMQTASTPRRLYHPWIFLGMLLVLSTPYYLAIGNPFTADDWLFLHHYRDASLFALFSPRVIWFWRPLQNVLFAGLYRAAGLNPVPYNLAGLGLYFIGAGLWYGLFLKLIGQDRHRTALALLASFILIADWQYCDTVFWTSNYGTLLYWLGTAWVLLAVASTPRRGAWVVPALGFIFALLSKESAVNIPFLAVAVWVYEHRDKFSASPRLFLREGARTLGPLFAILATYLAFHHFCVTDIEQVSKTGYKFVGPLAAGHQYLGAMNHVILFFDYAPRPFPIWLNLAFNFIETKLIFIPLLAWGWAFWRRDGLLILALVLASAALVPTVLLENFNSSRFYIVPASAMALAWAVAARRMLKALARWPAVPARMARFALAALLVFAAARSIWQMTALVRFDREMCRTVGLYQEAIAAQRGKLPPDACLVFDGLDRYPENGFGLREMTKMLLDSERAEGFRNRSVLDDNYARMLNANYPNKYRIGRDPRGRVAIEPLGNVQLIK